MQADPPSDFLTLWRRCLDRPIATTLLLSLSLHLAVLIGVQPAPGGGRTDSLVIQAQLVTPAPELPEASVEVPPEPIPETPPEPMPVVPEKPAPETVMPPLMTSHVPSPAPPLPVPPTPIVEAPAAVTSVPAVKPVSAPVAEISAVTPPIPAGQPARSEASAALGVGIDTTWYLARQVDAHARAVQAITPDYPDTARRRGQEGSVKLMVKIDDLGRVRDVEVVESEMNGVFDEAALEAFRQARFHPAMKDGRPVRYQAYIRVVFRLRD